MYHMVRNVLGLRRSWMREDGCHRQVGTGVNRSVTACDINLAEGMGGRLNLLPRTGVKLGGGVELVQYHIKSTSDVEHNFHDFGHPCLVRISRTLPRASDERDRHLRRN